MVDDEIDITAVLSRGLKKHGFDVDTFIDPERALKQFRPRHYDAIILDVRMNGMTGFGLAKEIWARDADARICFFSAFEIYEKEAQMVFRNFKAHCFIRKPITVSALAKHVESHVLIAK